MYNKKSTWLHCLIKIKLFSQHIISTYLYCYKKVKESADVNISDISILSTIK